jgi:hypothetical protein
MIMIPDASFSAVSAALESDGIKRGGRFLGTHFDYAILREIARSIRREAI